MSVLADLAPFLDREIADEGLLGLAYGGPEIGKSVAVKEFLRRRENGGGNKVA